MSLKVKRKTVRVFERKMKENEREKEEENEENWVVTTYEGK